MELAKYKACICEGSAEEAIIDILVDNDLLIFNREEMLEERVIRCRSAKRFEERYLRKGFDEQISVIRILDSRREEFRLSKAYEQKIDVVNVITAPEIEMLIIHAEGAYVFVMIGLYAGLRREEILGLKWDCVFLDEKTPYISVRRAWHVEGGEPVVNTLLKTPAAKRDVPIPKCLVACLKEEREKSESEYVISNSKGTVLTETQFVRVWKYITVRSTAERCYYTYVNGQSIKHRIKPRLGEHQPNNPKLVYTMDFKVTPHMLRHTYITNLIYKGVDPKTVQYLAGHENSKTTMDIYAKVKYNKPEELSSVVNAAFGLR